MLDAQISKRVPQYGSCVSVKLVIMIVMLLCSSVTFTL